MCEATNGAWIRRTIDFVDTTIPSELSAVFSLLRSGALIVNPNGLVLEASKPARALGLVLDQRITNTELAALVQQVHEDGKTRKADIRLPMVGQPPRQLSTRVALLNTQHVLALIEDRTKERRVEAIRRDFVANVSHELMTPVGAIKVLAETLTEAATDPDAVRRFAGRLQGESDRLVTLVRQIIELSRLQGDAQLQDPSPVRLDELIAGVFDTNRTDAETRQIQLACEGPTELSVLGDAAQLAVAVNNLVANAIAYSPEGTSVVVSTTDLIDSVELGVSDQGIGIPQADLDRVFERFYRVDPARARSTGGTGLGLSLVKHIAASHGGEVKVRSKEGRGSTFTLVLPKQADTDSEELAG